MGLAATFAGLGEALEALVICCVSLDKVPVDPQLVGGVAEDVMVGASPDTMEGWWICCGLVGGADGGILSVRVFSFGGTLGGIVGGWELTACHGSLW